MTISLGPLVRHLRIIREGSEWFYDCLEVGCTARHMQRRIVWKHFRDHHKKLHDWARSQLVSKVPAKQKETPKSGGIRGKRTELVAVYLAGMHRADLELDVEP